ncbi:MAG: NADH-dependent [FeFe] hydrogenase, group A6 [Clostridia bacterium]|nr:NADH-dependent [FeFe] hydrogenase, group A6 [Clostridia bacterium]
MKNINCKINGTPLSVPTGTTILEAARTMGIEIPTLCYMREKNEIGACRICVVEVTGARTLVTACVMPVSEGMEIKTHSDRVLKARKKTLELIMSNHNCSCLSCDRSENCELQTLARNFGVDFDIYNGEKTEAELDESSPAIVRDDSKCILCRRCVAACHTQTGVIGANHRGFDTMIGCAFEMNLNDVACVNCGQCIEACPVGALVEKDQITEVFNAINDPEKIVVVQTAPAVRAAIAEGFGEPIGTMGKGKMVAALRRLGFDKVFDTNFSADLTIMEEGTELIDRIQNGGVLPMITTCSPGWIKYCEHYFPDFIPNLSTCKSPQQMFGACVKTWWAERNKIDPKNIVSVSIMPCTAKKFEAEREEMKASSYPDVDYALTTRELIKMIKRAGIQWEALPDEEFDSPLGEGTGAAVIFGATGGVTEAALRTAIDAITGQENSEVDYREVRGMKGIKEASYTANGVTLNIAVVSGLDNAKKVLESVRNGEKNYHFIEVMCCPGGCINGGGQPIHPNWLRESIDINALRAEVLYKEDKNLPQRKSHHNSAIDLIYKEYFSKPNSHKAHEVLHTHYKDRSSVVK